MALSSLNLDAFVSLAKSESFTEAAESLHITQSALSQRIKNLEHELGLTLFLRTTSGAKLTEQGQKLLRYCQNRDSLESELLNDLKVNKSQTLSGTVRIAGYSTVVRSVIIPALTPFFKKHPNVLCEFICSKMEELPHILNRGEVGFIVMDYLLEKLNLESIHIGKESYVAIESKKKFHRQDVYLDNNMNDLSTEKFFRAQKRKPPKYQRSYMDECYGIIDGVKAGLGKAIMSEHLVINDPEIQIKDGYAPFVLDVYLYHHTQPFYSKLHQAIVRELELNAKKYLS